VVQKSSVTVQVPSTLQADIINKMEQNRARLKVMCGAADKIENLLPRN
jgi:hypothetical protein